MSNPLSNLADAVEVEIRKLAEIIVVAFEASERAEKARWEVGDQLLRLEKMGMKMTVVCEPFVKMFAYKTLMEFKAVAAAVKTDERNPALSFETTKNAIKQIEAVEREAFEMLGDAAKDFHFDRKAILDELAVPSNSRRSVRDLGQDLAKRARKELLPIRHELAEKAIASTPPEIIGHCHFGDYVETLEKMGPESIKVLFMDPPYAQYGKFDDGRLDYSTSAAMSGAENITQDDAIDTTIAAFELAATRLVKDGVILLWQAGRHLRPAIVLEAERCGFEIGLPIVWDKSRPQAGDLSVAISQSVEFCWIIQRKGEKLYRLTEMAREQVRRWKPVQHKATSLNETHLFEKPAESNDELLDIVSVEGDVVFETHGCTGSMSVSCIKKNRRFVYCELHEENFKLGFTRIEEARRNSETSETPLREDEPPAAELVAA